MIGAAFGMADDDVAAAGIGQHRGRDVAGMGAAGLGMAVLRRRGDAAPSSALADRRNQVAGGQISISREAGRRLTPASRSARASPSAGRPFIFQLPAISGRGLPVDHRLPAFGSAISGRRVRAVA